MHPSWRGRRQVLTSEGLGMRRKIERLCAVLLVVLFALASATEADARKRHGKKRPAAIAKEGFDCYLEIPTWERRHPTPPA
jgi:hypothetical protein